MENNEEFGCIYMHKNKKDGKIYIGQTIQKPEIRWSNGKGYMGSPLLWDAIVKDGWSNFEHTIIEENISKDKLDEREQYYISLYKSNKFQFGYNLTEGGKTATGHLTKIEKSGGGKKKPIRCIETGEEFESIKAANIAFGLVPNSCNIQRVLKGDQKTCKGYTFEYINPEDNTPKTNRPGKPVRCINTGEIFISATLAANSLGLFGRSTSVISRACIGKSPYGKDKDGNPLYWEYVTDENHISSNRKETSSFGKAVRCKNNQKVFNKIVEASIWAGLPYADSRISYACMHPDSYAGKHPETGEKLYWEYVTED